MRARARLVVMAALVAAGCGSSRPAARAPLPPAPQVVDVTVTDHGFGYNPVIHPGTVVFVCHDVGSKVHTVRIFPVDNGLPPVDQQLHGKHRVSVQGVGGTRVQPGQSDSFALVLVQNQRYFVLDLDRDSDGVIYADKGLDSEFRAR